MSRTPAAVLLGICALPLVSAVSPPAEAGPAGAVTFGKDLPYLEIGHCKELDLREAVTLEAWIRPERLPGGGARIIDKSVPGSSAGYTLDTYPGNSLRLICADGNRGHPADLPAGKWSHVVVVFGVKENALKFFVNGKVVLDNGKPGMKPLSSCNSPLRIGADRDGGNTFSGQMAKIAVYNRALTDTEVARLAAAPGRGSLSLRGRVIDCDFSRFEKGGYVNAATGNRKLNLMLPGGRLAPVRPVELAGEAPPPRKALSLWYRRPAAKWVEALPVGNGRLGGMVFGGVSRERIQLNDDALWEGGPKDRVNPKGLEALPEVRRLMFEGKNGEAAGLASRTMMGIPHRIKSYQTLGDLYIDMPELGSVSNYRRELDLETGLARTTFEKDGATYTRDVFSSAVDQVLAVRVSCDRPGSVDLGATIVRQRDASTSLGPGKVRLEGACDSGRGMRFFAELRVVPVGGRIEEGEKALAVRGADSVTMFLASATSLRHEDPGAVVRDQLDRAAARGYGAILRDHEKDHAGMFNRVAIDLGPDPRPGLPTDERVAAYKREANDPHLEAMLFQYGRYLLMGSSRPGSLPANLQGIWNEHFRAPWNSDFHTNINLQMNYWPAEVTNLAEAHLPLFDLMESLVAPGGDVARRLYGARGWVVHHLTDVWGFAVPADGIWGVWPMGAAWLCQHPWWHYEFSGDVEFLRERGYPLMKGASEFMLDFLVEAPEGTPVAGRLVTNPSHSPENSFVKDDGKRHQFTYAATMDVMIVHDLFTNTIAAADVLGVDGEFRRELEGALSRLPPLAVSKRTGALQEWVEDYKEASPRHRHISHMFGLHPGRQITPRGTPPLAEAIRQTLNRRGDGGTGWSKAWKVNAWARLHDGDRAHKLLRELLKRSILPNLFDSHPPFQIDGNFGACSGVAEMLLQCHTGDVHLLPALPSAWPAGSVSGLRARGGFDVAIEWADGELKEATLRPKRGGEMRIQYGQSVITRRARAGRALRVGRMDFR